MPITLPETITPGTLADAQEVQDNFDALAAAAANVAGDTFTGTINVRDVLPSTDAARDLGSASFRFRNIYISGAVIGPSATNAFGTIAVSGSSDVVADNASDTLTLVAGTGMLITQVAGTDTITFANSGAAQAGASAVNYKSGGILYNSQASTPNVGTGEDTIATQAIAANVLSADGACLRFTAFGTLGNNANIKRFKVKFGATTILDTSASFSPSASSSPSMNGWVIRGEIVRTGASAQVCVASITTNYPSVDLTNFATASETLSGAVTWAITAEATDNDDVICKGFRIEYQPTSGN